MKYKLPKEQQKKQLRAKKGICRLLKISLEEYYNAVFEGGIMMIELHFKDDKYLIKTQAFWIFIKEIVCRVSEKTLLDIKDVEIYNQFKNLNKETSIYWLKVNISIQYKIFRKLKMTIDETEALKKQFNDYKKANRPRTPKSKNNQLETNLNTI